jgi:DNA modification methylase
MKQPVQTTFTGERFEDWDFDAKIVDTQYLTHGLHPFPARMIPQIAKRLIIRYSDVGDVILDPFCGSGGVLVEARLQGRNSIGNDINHFALLLAKVKTTPFVVEFHDFLDRIETDVSKYRKGDKKIKIPFFPNINHWFKDYVIKELAIIRSIIEDVEDMKLRDLAKVCFSKTIFGASNIDLKSSYYLRTLPKEELQRHRPNVFDLFKTSLADAIKRVNQFAKECQKTDGVWTKVMMGDARHLSLENNTIDLVVTSPPYGEEKNTIDYARWSKLVLYWLGYTPEAIKKMKERALGGAGIKSLQDMPSATVNNIIKKVAKENPTRAKDALPFFRDYHISLAEIYRVLKDGARCCIVIGNRSIGRHRVDMGAATVELAENVGFSHEITHYRKFPYKAIPFISGDVETMTRENIVILAK